MIADSCNIKAIIGLATAAATPPAAAAASSQQPAASFRALFAALVRYMQRGRPKGRPPLDIC